MCEAVWRVRGVKCRKLSRAHKGQRWDVVMGDLVEGGLAFLRECESVGDSNEESRSVSFEINSSAGDHDAAADCWVCALVHVVNAESLLIRSHAFFHLVSPCLCRARQPCQQVCPSHCVALHRHLCQDRPGGRQLRAARLTALGRAQATIW